MLENWLRPINQQTLEDAVFDETKLGGRILRNEYGLPDLKSVSLAIIGIGEEEADEVRKALYRMSFAFGSLKIADLGNVRREDNSFIVPLIKDLLDGGICPILIGRKERYILSQFEAHHSKHGSVSLSVVDERIAFHPIENELDGHFLNPIFNNKSRLFHFSAIGCQSHFLDDEILHFLESKHFDMIRLGKAKTTFSDMEPFIRDADMVSFNLRALKNIEVPGVEDSSPSGFFSEEACQICRYAGMSDKLTSIGFYGFQKEFDSNPQSPRTVAQMIWYFIDGYYNRKNDFPASMDGLMEYIVDFKGHDYQLTFWKSNKTGRWWMQVPAKTKKKHQRHHLIPCSYNDYVLASQEDLPDRLINAHKRFE